MTSQPPGSGIRSLKTRALIVEDDADSAELMAILLDQSGCEVRTASSASEALALVASFCPEVAFLDVSLPDMTGYELLAALRRLPQLERCRFVAVTGHVGPDALRASRDAGFHAHLTKPIELDKLRAQLAHDLVTAVR